MDTMGVDPQLAKDILVDELGMYQATRFRLTTRLRVLNRVGIDEQARRGLVDELEKLEAIIGEYEQEIGHLAHDNIVA